jgi:YD repeat-containing protein
MLRIVDLDELKVYPLSSDSSGERCSKCDAHRPAPELDGSLLVDPEIKLSSPGMNIDIEYYYNSNSSYNGPYGYQRTMSTNLLAQASGSPLIVTMTRGDGSNVTYQENTSGSYVSYSPRNLDTLAQDTVDNLWKETTQDGITTAYPLNTTGQITSVSYIQDAIGNRHTYSYSSGRLANIEDAVGRLITFAYNSSNVLSTIEDWAGHLTTFAYNTTLISGSPVLTTVTGPSGCEVVYAYNSSGQLTEITNPNGYATNYNYDSNGYITSRIVAGTYVSTYTYGAGFTTVAEPATAIVTNTLDSNYNIAGAVSAKSGVTTYTRNSKGQEISRQVASGAVHTTTYDSNGYVLTSTDSLGNTTTVQRDAYGNPTTVIYADGATEANIYGYAGSSFDTTGQKKRLQVRVDALGNRTTYSYNRFGQMTSQTNALGYVTTYSYDSFGNRNAVTDPLGHTTTSVYDASGNVIQSIDPLGNISSATYDPQNRQLTSTDPLGHTTTVAYDSVGNLIVKIRWETEQATLTMYTTRL